MVKILALLLPALLAAQSATLRIRLPGAEGAVRPAGARTAGLTVEVTDELGKPVAGAIVSVQLPDDGPGGSFANGLNSDIITTGEDGRATTSPIRWNRLTGSFEIRVTASKDRLRAGTMVIQQLSDVPARAATPAARSKSHRRLLVIGVLAASAAGAGFATGWASRSSSRSAPQPEPLQIGSPVVSIGKP